MAANTETITNGFVAAFVFIALPILCLACLSCFMGLRIEFKMQQQEFSIRRGRMTSFQKDIIRSPKAYQRLILASVLFLIIATISTLGSTISAILYSKEEPITCVASASVSL